MSRRTFRKTTSLLFLALALLVALAACRPSPHADHATPPPAIDEVVDVWRRISESAIPTKENTIIEVWNSLSEQFVERDTLDAAALSKAAIEAMLNAENSGAAALDPRALSGVAIEAMLETLNDPYTVYMSPEQYARYLESSKGEFEGIGAHVNLIDGRITIVAPIPDTPAERAGIKAGDVIIEVDGVSTRGWSLPESVSRIRGIRGTSVRLLVERRDVPEPTLIEVVRETITIDSVQWSILPGSVAHLRILSFAENTDEILAEALEEMMEQDVEAIVLDLRNNPGGSLETTINVASEFLDEELVLYLIYGNGDRYDFTAKEDGLALDIPLVVLVNNRSASGSEVLAAALQDRGRASIVGTTTFGKGSANLAKPLSDGSGLYFTTGRWYSPDGRLIEGKGLKPDIVVTDGPDGHDDPQLDRALEHLGIAAAPASR